MASLVTSSTLKPGSYAPTSAVAGATRYTAIARIEREIPDTAPSRDSNDTLFQITIENRQLLRRRSEPRPLQGQLMKGQT